MIADFQLIPDLNLYLTVATKRGAKKLKGYPEACRVIGNDFLPAAFEYQGSMGEMFVRYFEDCLQKKAEELGMKSLGPLRWYWQQSLSIDLQRHVPDVQLEDVRDATASVQRREQPQGNPCMLQRGNEVGR